MNIINTYCPCFPTQSPGATFMAVLTQGSAKDFAVYVGIVNLREPKGAQDEVYEGQRVDAAHWVAAHGSKQTYKEALAFFPRLTEKEYRR